MKSGGHKPQVGKWNGGIVGLLSQEPGFSFSAYTVHTTSLYLSNVTKGSQALGR